MVKYNSVVLCAGLLLSFSHVAFAGVTPQQAAELGKSLTPVGGEMAGNADGTIPAYTGGITEFPAGYQPGDHHVDPFAEDEVLFTIDGSNYQSYADKLSAGQIALFEAYPDTYKMPVYPTRRSASFPQRVYDAIKENAVNAELINDGAGFIGATVGSPFPIPENGLEAIWNHTARYRGEMITRQAGQAAVTESGAYTFIGLDEQFLLNYAVEGMTPQELLDTNILFKFKQSVTSPARLAGTALLVHETLDQVKEPRQAWTYNTGQRRVRRAPNLAYDAPGTATDGLRTTDDFDMFNGSPDRYTWELKGKREMYVAYNNYQLHSDQLQYDDILMPGHINPQHARYELHRVWEVEATLKSGFRHIYEKRTFFLDEDSWQVMVADMYDNRGELYRVAVSHVINYYDKKTLWSTLDVYHDLNSRRYLALGLDNQERMYDFSSTLAEAEFTPQALRREGRR